MIDPSLIDPAWDDIMISKMIRAGDRKNAVRLYTYTLRRDMWLELRRRNRPPAAQAPHWTDYLIVLVFIALMLLGAALMIGGG